MYCPKCGNRNEEYANFCAKCGYEIRKYQNQYGNGSSGSGYSQPWYAKPPYSAGFNAPEYSQNTYPNASAEPQDDTLKPVMNNYLPLAIITIFFNIILGIIAVIYASRSNNCYRMGNYAGAVSNAKTAKILSMVGIAVGIVFLGLSLISSFNV